MDKPKFDRLRELFSQIISAENEIEKLIGEGTIATPKSNPNTPWRKQTNKAVGDYLSGRELKKRGRQKKIRNYVCEDCGKPTITNLPPSTARCISCRSRNVVERDINKEILEINN